MAAPIGDIAIEFAKVALPDIRLIRRLHHMVGELARDPAASFPRAFGDVAGTEAGYRFLRNPRVEPQSVLAPHREEAWLRAQGVEAVLAIEDTTEMRFGGRVARTDLGPLMNDGHGFFLHAALLVSFGPTPTPLGISNYEILVRDGKNKQRRKKGVHWKKVYGAPDNERLRWNRVVDAVADAAAAAKTSVIHVGDREADSYALMSHCLSRSQRFVFRMRFDRRDACSDELASAIVSRAPVLIEREVQLATRTRLGEGRRKSKHPRPTRRTARLAIRATQVLFPRPRHAVGEEPYLPLNLVEVIEIEPSMGEEPIHWRLLTTEPIDSAKEVERVVDIYRARWLIEEFWKALKTGCAFEDRQLESRKTLETALAILMPIAWHLLLVRATARSEPTAPATTILSPRQLKILVKVASKKNRWGVRLPPSPCAKDVAYGVARMGGHLTQNGEPGWQVLRRGLDALYGLEAALELLDGDAEI